MGAEWRGSFDCAGNNTFAITAPIQHELGDSGVTASETLLLDCLEQLQRGAPIPFRAMGVGLERLQKPWLKRLYYLVTGRSAVFDLLVCGPRQPPLDCIPTGLSFWKSH
jgi:hypothetical protein